ncbi:MAG TPA: MFS transporter [Thermoanaerobaculia bacterium]|nr:MFS transporter [Thermoanaerobaculia bacterium]
MSENGTSLKTFTTIWVGQLISILGSGLTAFALGIWVLQRTQSVTQYTLIIVFSGVTGLLLAPFAGALVDRWDRRLVLIACNLGSGLGVATLSYLLWLNQLHIWHIYIVVTFTAALNTFQWPALISSITMLVDRKHYGRVNGLMEFGQSGAGIAAPALAGFLMTFFKIWDILVVDFVTFLFAAFMLFLVRIPRPEQSAATRAAKGSLWKEAGYGWTYIKERPGLLHLLSYFAVVNLVGAVCGVALMPMVLGFSSKAGVGTVMSLVSVGTLVGGLLMTVTGGPRPRVYGILGYGVVTTIAFVLIGLKPSLLLVSIGVILWYVALPIMNSSSQAIWQSKVEPGVQGRVFAVRRMIAQFTVPIGDFSAGPLADKVFNPMLMPGGALSGSVGRVIGVGPGRGIALMFLAGAIFPALAAIWGFLNPRLRNVETEIPDAVKRAMAPPPPPEPAPAPENTAAGEAPA